MKVDYVPKEKLFPYFGTKYKNEDRIEIREDLPEIVQQFVLYHEYYHLSHNHWSILYEEIRANLYGFGKTPLGFFYCLWLTIIDIERLKDYFNRLVLRRKNGSKSI